MDIFGYRFIENESVISKYLIIELKNSSADINAVGQIIQYVDWVADEYAYGDYSMIEAYLVASAFDDEAKTEAKKNATRNYSKGWHPPVFDKWNNLKLVKYSFDANDILGFTNIML